MTGRNDADWRPGASIERLRKRGELLRQVRGFFDNRGVLEVETPLLSEAASTDPMLETAQVQLDGRTAPLYLHTSPEFFMKRLLAAGSGPIWQICRVVRGNERGQRHNPEFTMLEWYRPGWDHQRLITEVTDLIQALCGARPIERFSYAQLFAPFGIDPHRSDTATVGQHAENIAGAPMPGLDRNALLDLILGQEITPTLGRDCIAVVDNFPATQAALARIRPGDPPLAERFEVFVDGMELANGFHELGDADEQRRRFAADQQLRREKGQTVRPVDERFLAALDHGLPDCAGVALGLDRLLMVALGAETIDEVMAFPIERA
ncbi:EF-P lysine aminoacylase EpmA [Methylonatrum kenyense]|uniref:EF-P lysine aminoacylase EpmA n=1 Tax=Methylonatrum kenyense TaxID=455253 RepID=UPI0020BDFD4F|nr:EF-P lysine aminoacylase EpmA [Methylonatrum kenyense]MCK8515137.1 EF-P lysine aminoacylase EpmA [Methylonatrum kenyense]